MPIRFRCKRCYQMLGIASRKAGADIECPKCGYSQVVPSEEAAAAALAMDRVARSPAVTESPSDLVVYDDEPSAIEMPRPRREPDASAGPAVVTKAPARSATATEAEPAGDGGPSAPGRQPPGAASPATAAVPSPAAAPSPAAEPDEAAPAPVEGEPVPRGMILFPRHTFYVQGLLFVIFGAVVFTAGYFMGRGDARVDLARERDELAKDRMPLEGTLTYRPDANQVKPDERAVVMALPVDTFPEKKLTFQGIRPSDPEPPNSHPTLRGIKRLGGAYARADEEGKFFTVVPDKGTYRVLLISAHSPRPEGNDVHEPDLLELSNYFSQPELLISRYRYRLTREEINTGFNPIELDFDEPEKD